MTPREQLIEMLTYRRPAGSKAERKFINRFLRPLGGKVDEAGNIIIRVGDDPVMWSCHTDTVHKSGGRQVLDITDKGYVTAPKSTCLGADDTIGVWIMVQMIERNIPGLYIFHRAEEVGGYGSLHIAKTNRELLNGIDYAIALDRKGYSSIVTHQWGGRCCSDTFAHALGASLGLNMKPDDTGTFTDTANYMDLVPECTNISVGYLYQHTRTENTYIPFAEALLEALCALDVRTLPVVREPGDNDVVPVDTHILPFDDQEPLFNTYGLDKYEALREVVRRHPDVVADFLDQYGVSADEIMGHANVPFDQAA